MKTFVPPFVVGLWNVSRTSQLCSKKSEKPNNSTKSKLNSEIQTTRHQTLATQKVIRTNHKDENDLIEKQKWINQIENNIY